MLKISSTPYSRENSTIIAATILHTYKKSPHLYNGNTILNQCRPERIDELLRFIIQSETAFNAYAFWLSQNLMMQFITQTEIYDTY